MENFCYAELHCSTERTGMMQSMEVNCVYVCVGGEGGEEGGEEGEE